MNRLPSPFQNDLPQILTSPAPSSSPGFLMMTRPPSASLEGPGRNAGRGNHRSGGFYPRAQGLYSTNSPNGLIPFRNQNKFHNRGGQNRGGHSPHFYDKKQKSLPTPSPNRNFNNDMRSFSGPLTFQSTPNHPNNNRDRGKSFNKNPFFNANKSKHNTPLKDIPVDKFVSTNMIHDPWVAFPSDIDCAQNTDSLFTDEGMAGDADSNTDDEGGSTNESQSTIETTDSPLGYGTPSDKDIGTESDTASDV